MNGADPASNANASSQRKVNPFSGLTLMMLKRTAAVPTASAIADGQTFVIKDEGGNANNNNITISCSVGGDKIDGQNLIVLESPYASVRLYCDGINKYFIT